MNKFELLKKQNRANLEYNNYIHFINSTFQTTIERKDFLPLDTSLSIMDGYYQKLEDRNYEKQIFKSNQVDEIIGFIHKTFLNAVDYDYYLITKLSDFCGLVKISKNKALIHFLEIIEFDGDSLALVSVDTSKGIYIDYYEEKAGDKQGFFYDVIFW